jgi:hypothetical protein
VAVVWCTGQDLAISSPVVQMTAIKRPVYCAQLPAICQSVAPPV